MRKFTLIELLIVVAIIGILLSLLLPSLKRARHISMKTVCLSNTSQISKLFYKNSLNHDGYVFKHESDNIAANPWDLPTALYRELGEPPRDLFYCPLRKERNSNEAWDDLNHKLPAKVTGYFYTWKRQAGMLDSLTTHSWVEKISRVNNPGENPLVGDTVIKYNGKFESPALWSVALYSSHFPEGFKDMSITYTDGHSKFAKWGSFSQQLTRFGREIWW